jgi:putative ABC transport system permease protein
MLTQVTRRSLAASMVSLAFNPLGYPPGVLAGIAGALALSRLLSGFLYSIGAADPLTYCAVALVLLFVGLVASYLPTRRATRIDPIVALRHE